MAYKPRYGCTIKQVDDLLTAALRAIDINPVNAPLGVVPPGYIGVLKYWGDRAKDLTYGFTERVSTEFQKKIDLYANKWGEFSKAKFRFSSTEPMIRIGFENSGYWSYLGPDCLQIPRNQQTMNLQGFTTRTPDSEWDRVVVHEFGHVLGCPHEHQRKEIIDRLNPDAVYKEFRRTQGWSDEEIRQQVLTPIEERSLMGASPADEMSIMAYSFPSTLTKDRQPIVGGSKLSPIDREFFSKIYPRDDVIVPPPTSDDIVITIDKDRNIKINGKAVIM